MVIKNPEQGIDLTRYKVIPRTLIFLFDNQNRILLIKGSPNKKRWAGLYNGIGGHVEVNEDVLEGAKRELFEETGIKEAELRLCGQIMVNVSSDLGIALFVFCGKYEKSDFRASPEGEIQWIPIKQIENFPIVDDLPILLPLVVAHKAGDPMIIGKYSYDRDGEFIASLH
jgi:8-oxo-dGTP diphosphatase